MDKSNYVDRLIEEFRSLLTDLHSHWELCEVCGGMGDVPDTNFYCHACKGEGGALVIDQAQIDADIEEVVDAARHPAKEHQ